MAQYTRFEIYIPTVYRIKEPDPHTGREHEVVHALSDESLRQFISEAMRYEGITQANPLAPALYKGWWRSKSKGKLTIDYLTYLFGLIRIDQSDEAMKFFGRWQQKFKLTADQEVILLIYYPVQTIGDFF